MGIFRKFMSKAAEDEPDNREGYRMSLLMFEFWMDVQDFKGEPDPVRGAQQLAWGGGVCQWSWLDE